MSGHKVEITGVHGRLPTEQEGHGDLEIINEFVTEYDLTDPAELSMVVWGEDLARVPLLVYNDEGELIWQAPELSEAHARKLDVAAGLINDVLAQENAAATA